VVADDGGDGRAGGVDIVDVGRLPGRVNRMLRSTRRVFEKALELDADVFHLHDPELIPAGLRLKRMGKTVIFDAHEDVPSQLLGKPYLGPLRRRLLSHAFSAYERYACRQFDGIVAATPFIRDRLLPINPHTVNVNNYPLPAEFDAGTQWLDKASEVCYVGSIAAIRGIHELVRACALLKSPARLALGGTFSDPALAAVVSGLNGWERVDWLGQLDRPAVRAVMARAVAGLVTLHPAPNYLEALPVKMFEYMAAGIPVIASNFTLLRRIVEARQCGLCVDPLDPKAIAAAIDYLVMNPHAAMRMGDNGRRAVAEQYNWPIESNKLIAFYERL
jgi:glycosyltransferase involved in cell wall biosynthesis